MSRPAARGGLLSMAEAAERIGLDRPHAAQWLRRYLLALEEDGGRPVLVRVGRGKRRPTYRVSLVQLRRRCPELFDGRDEIDRALRGLVTSIGRRLETITESVDEQSTRLSMLTEATRRRGR